MDDKPIFTVEEAKEGLAIAELAGSSARAGIISRACREIIRLNQVIDGMKQEHDAEVQQMNDGFDAYKQGVPIDNEPSYDLDYDVWRIGWVWAQHNHPKPNPNMRCPECD